MKPFYKKLAIIFGIDIAVFLISFVIALNYGEAGMLLLIFWLVGTLLQVLVGVVLTFFERPRLIGQALLSAAILALLIGYSVCGSFGK